MKKLFVLMLTIVALTVSAAPVKKKCVMPDITKKAMPASALMHKVSVKNKATEATKNPRKATSKTVNITISGSYIFEYNAATASTPTGDWYFGAADDTGNYVVRLDYWASEADKYGTFTMDDIDPYYSRIVDRTTGDDVYVLYEEGTTFTVSQRDGKDIIDGTLIGDDGITYNLHVEHVTYTYNIEGTKLAAADFYDEDQDWFICFQNDDYRIYLDVITGSADNFDGTYTEAEGVMSYNYAANLNTNKREQFSTFNVTMKLGEGVTDPKRGCEITGTAIGTSGNTYNFHFLKTPPITPTDTVDINVDLQRADWPADYGSCKGYFELAETDAVGVSDGYKWTLGVDKILGEFDEMDIESKFSGRIDTTTGDTLKVDHGTVTETLDQETLILHVTADLTLSNAVCYRMSFDYQVETLGEVAYDFDNLVLDNSFYGLVGLQWLKASNDEVGFQLATNHDVPGTYDDNSAQVSLYFDNYTTTVDGITIFNATADMDEHCKPTLNCRFMAEDRKVYTINAHFAIPEITDSIDISIEGMNVLDLIDGYGAFQINGFNNDSTLYVTVAPETKQIPGHYTMSDLQTYSDYNYIMIANQDGSWQLNDMYTADFDVTMDGNDVTLTGHCQAGTHWVNLTLKGSIKVEGLSNDVSDADLDISFNEEDLSELVKYEDNGYAYVRLQNAERNDCFAMLIYLDSFDDDICFPEGTYQFSNTYAVNTVQQGSITNDLSTVYPTFYANCTKEGYLCLPLWLFRSGSVTISKTADNKLALEVNARNSYRRTCHIVYNQQQDNGIHDVDANTDFSTRKVLDGHQLIIQRGASKFNAAGQQL